MNNGAMYKGLPLNMAWQTPDGKTVPASPTVPSVRPQLSPVVADSRSVTGSFDDLDTETSPLLGAQLGLLEVCFSQMISLKAFLCVTAVFTSS